MIGWADGEVAKSPAAGPNGAISRAYDRLVFKDRLDGKNPLLIEAGYRDDLQVTPPSR